MIDYLRSITNALFSERPSPTPHLYSHTYEKLPEALKSKSLHDLMDFIEFFVQNGKDANKLTIGFVLGAFEVSRFSGNNPNDVKGNEEKSDFEWIVGKFIRDMSFAKPLTDFEQRNMLEIIAEWKSKNPKILGKSVPEPSL